MKRIIVFLISLIIVLIPIASHASASENEIKRPRLLIESGSAEPASVAGNTDFELKIKLKNIGTAAAHYIRVTAAAEDEDISLIEHPVFSPAQAQGPQGFAQNAFARGAHLQKGVTGAQPLDAIGRQL